MKRPALKSMMILVVISVSTLLGTVSAQSQADNLLENPGFETFDAGNVATGWEAWNAPIGPNSPSFERVPQYAAADGVESPRIQDGDNAQAFFTDFYYSFNAGLYQTVSGLTPDTTATFAVDLWVWSSNLDNRDTSSENADVRVAVGINPSGGTDGMSDSIIWSADVPAVYDSYNTYTISAVTGESATVFVRVNVNEALRNTVVFLDEASFTAEVADDGGEITEEPTVSIEEPLTVTESPDDAEVTDEPEATEETEEPIGTDAPSIVTSAPVATNTTAPTNTEVPTNTEAPTATDVPTNTAMPTATNTPEPTATDVPTEQDLGIILATDTPVEEIATEPPPPSSTPVPTETPIPTVTPVPSNTAIPTATPLPPVTITPMPTNTPEPGVIEPIESEPTEADVATDTDADAGTNDIGDTQAAEETEDVQQPPTPDPFPGSIIHTVERGDTVARLAVLYGSTSQRIIEANDLNSNGLIFVGQGLIIPVRVVAATDTPTPTPLVIVVTATPDGGQSLPVDGVYVVQPGDTLSAIANRFGTNLGDLAQLNGITNPNSITVGQQLLIPGNEQANPETPVTPEPTETYVVQPGDSLYRIAVRYGVTVQEIIEANNINTPNFIYSGQVLQIP